MVTDSQLEFWKEYIDLIGEENFSIQETEPNNFIVLSKFFCGIDPSDAQGGQSIVNVAVNRAKKYEEILSSKKNPSFNDFQNVLLSCVQSPYFHSELDHYLPKMMSKISSKQHWDLVSSCWTMQEFTTAGGRGDVWRRVLSLRKRPAALVRKLPNQFTAYRAGELSGFSWTLDKSVAIWFADRFRQEFGEVPVHQREFTKDEAVMYIEDRDEKEVVILSSIET